VAALVRPSVSACVADPVTGKGLKTGEHVYLVVDKPERSRDCLHALMRLAWVHGSGAAAGWLMPSARGSVLIRGPIDAIVGSPERLSYEGAGKIEQGLTALPRISRVIGGTGMLNADDLIAFADRNAGEQQYRARIAAAKSDPAFIAKRDAFEADYRATHIKKGAAQRVKKGVAPDEAEKQATASYDAVSAAGTCERGGRTWIPLADDHVLYWPNGEAFTIADIRANPAQFNGRECADPIEGLDYQSRNCAIIYTNFDDQIQIFSRAHGDAFAYVAPLDEVDWAELFARIEEPRSLGSGDEPDEPAASKPAADEAWDPWRETLAPRLDHSLLPRVVREAAATSARVSGADADAFAIGYLVGLTACADTRLRITPKQRARDWSVPLLLWVLLVAPPSSMKSEVIKTARALAASLDIQERERHGRDVAAAEVGAMLGGAAMTRAAAKRARAEAARTVAAPRQRVCGDITIEKLADILGANPGGCAVIHEEFGLARRAWTLHGEGHGRGRPRFLLRHARRLVARPAAHDLAERPHRALCRQLPRCRPARPPARNEAADGGRTAATLHAADHARGARLRGQRRRRRRQGPTAAGTRPAGGAGPGDGARSVRPVGGRAVQADAGRREAVSDIRQRHAAGGAHAGSVTRVRRVPQQDGADVAEPRPAVPSYRGGRRLGARARVNRGGTPRRRDHPGVLHSARRAVLQPARRQRQRPQGSLGRDRDPVLSKG
jgi:hypothetical protein